MIIDFTKAAARELIGKGIYVNALAPAFVETEGLRVSTAIEGMALSGFIQAVFGTIPLGRLGTPEEVTPLAVFLASDESSFMVGQVLSAKRGPVGLARPQYEVNKQQTPDSPSGVRFVSLSGLCRPPAYH